MLHNHRIYSIDPQATDTEALDETNTGHKTFSPKQVYDAVNAHQSPVTHLPRVASIPDDWVGDIILLDHNYTIAGKDDAIVTLTSAQGFIGFSTGILSGIPVLGSSNKSVAPLGLMLVESGHITKIASNNRVWLNGLDKFEMDGVEYDLSDVTQVSGGYFRTITNPPTGVPNQDIVINGKRLDGTWWLGVADIVHQAGEYNWDYTSTPPAYERTSQFDGIDILDIAGNLLVKATQIELGPNILHLEAGSKITIGVSDTHVTDATFDQTTKTLEIELTGSNPPITVDLGDLTDNEFVSAILNDITNILTFTQEDGGTIEVDFSPILGGMGGGGGTGTAKVTGHDVLVATVFNPIANSQFVEIDWTLPANGIYEIDVRSTTNTGEFNEYYVDVEVLREQLTSNIVGGIATSSSAEAHSFFIGGTGGTFIFFGHTAADKLLIAFQNTADITNPTVAVRELRAVATGTSETPDQVTIDEIEAGTETEIRSYSPVNVDQQISHSAPNFDSIPAVDRIPDHNIGEIIYLANRRE